MTPLGLEKSMLGFWRLQRGSTRANRELEARLLRNQGLLLREIAESMGLAVSTVDAYLNDPGGARLKARKKSYGGECFVCGGPTDGSGGIGRAGDLCRGCREWPAEACIEAIKLWAEDHGGVPPTSQQWATADVGHPCSTTVAERCGGWNAALLRAGFSLRRDVRPETQEWVEDQIRAGVPTVKIAAELGVSVAAIYGRFRYRGLRIRDLRDRVVA